MSKPSPSSPIRAKITLTLVTLSVCFVLVEVGYRLLDPFPFYSARVVNMSQRGNLSTFDPLLGWTGSPGGQAELVTVNNRVPLSLNTQGHRDIEHTMADTNRQAIVFLGDSFTWGYEVTFEEMFVNRFRRRMPAYSVFNLSHRGYGTDQSFLMFTETWQHEGAIRLVVLMFSENDVLDNASSVRYEKRKPRYRLRSGELHLTGVPIEEDRQWKSPLPDTPKPSSWKVKLQETLFMSHLLHDIWWQFYVRRPSSSDESPLTQQEQQKSLRVTEKLLEALRDAASQRGAAFAVGFVPSKLEIEHIGDEPPYQRDIAAICDARDIPYFDLGPAMSKTRGRKYFRMGMHWNAAGHAAAADGIYSHLDRLLRKAPKAVSEP
jgi:lysophospholipase L1-like esterase